MDGGEFLDIAQVGAAEHACLAAAPGLGGNGLDQMGHIPSIEGDVEALVPAEGAAYAPGLGEGYGILIFHQQPDHSLEAVEALPAQIPAHQEDHGDLFIRFGKIEIHGKLSSVAAGIVAGNSVH